VYNSVQKGENNIADWPLLQPWPREGNVTHKVLSNTYISCKWHPIKTFLTRTVFCFVLFVKTFTEKMPFSPGGNANVQSHYERISGFRKNQAKKKKIFQTPKKFFGSRHFEWVGRKQQTNFCLKMALYCLYSKHLNVSNLLKCSIFLSQPSFPLLFVSQVCIPVYYSHWMFIFFKFVFYIH
jgi:hypothetical protein